jgi:hypothetical protein
VVAYISIGGRWFMPGHASNQTASSATELKSRLRLRGA